MRARDIARWVAESATCAAPASQTYLFGSAMRAEAAWSDIDLLVVCRQEVDAVAIRDALAPLCLRYPIDLIIMTRVEEAELSFIDSEACELVTHA